MASPKRGDVWLVDLGMAAKIRPCLVLSVEPTTTDRMLLTMVPHTTSVRGTQFEAATSSKFLKTGAFDAQGLVTIAPPRLIRKLGELSTTELFHVAAALKLWLGL